MVLPKIKLYKFVLLLILCSFTLMGLSQEKPHDKTFSVLLSPALLRAPETQWGLQTGIAYQRPKWGVGAEAALPFRKSHIDYATIKYLRVGLELKYYAYNDHSGKIYISLQNNYALRQMMDTNGNTYTSKRPLGVFRFSKASISSPIFSSALKFGAEVPITKNLFMDVFSGAGIRIVSTSYKNVENTTPGSLFRAIDCCTFIPVYRYEGTFTKLHLTTGFRLGYVISRK